ncbi:Flavonoid 3'-monooxygenase [Morella rubra]|uniref:Flavonoid 3'-monooxygenase n=1 Tax=Morella rubra TaxID=262757 RepID=A0A6A1W2N4_9ROSI|nr:Flavonoid 3'-monooxygenase [Morella rubra]
MAESMVTGRIGAKPRKILDVPFFNFRAAFPNIYGPIYKVWLGQKLWVVVNSPSLVKEVVRDQDTTFVNRDPPIAALVATYGGADITFLPYGHEWKKLRKIFVRKMLSNAALDDSYTLRREQLRKGIRNVYEKICTPIDVGQLAFVTLINGIMSLLWGDTLQGEEGANIAVEFKVLLAEIMVLFAKPNVSDFFPGLARLTQIKASLADVLVGGSDTTTTTEEWVMAELMHHPEAMRRVHGELTEMVGLDCIVEESHLPKLNYLGVVIKETFRLHPVLPLLVPRSPSQSSTIGIQYPKFEWELPPGTEVDLSDRFGIVTKKRMPLVAIPTPKLSKFTTRKLGFNDETLRCSSILVGETFTTTMRT